jgi:uncharacterized membrane protein YjjP (DUF1212 family)
MVDQTMQPEGHDLQELQTFAVQLGAAMNAAGQPAHIVQEELHEVAHAYGASAMRVTAFPTFLMVTMGSGEPVALELTMALAASPRLDQIAALDRLVNQAKRAEIRPADGLARLQQIREMQNRFGRVVRILGYAVFAVGVCLILRPSLREVPAAALFGVIIGWLRAVGRRQPTLQVLMPVVAAVIVSSLSALAVRHGLLSSGMRPMVAALVVFLPGAALTTAVLELAAGQMISGSSRLMSGCVQLALLAFGILAGIEAVDSSATRVLFGSSTLLGPWAPWLGVLVFAVGVVLANSAPPKSFLSLLVVLYAAFSGQVLSNIFLGAYISALLGALVMTVMSRLVSRSPSAMPAHALFVPGFWLLVPGTLGLIGITKLSVGGGSQEIVATVGSIFAIALGVLCGTQVLEWGAATGRFVGGVSDTLAEQQPKVRRLMNRFGTRPPRSKP